MKLRRELVNWKMDQKREIRVKDREENAGKEQAGSRKHKEYSKREAGTSSMCLVRV